jgi:hypothetical protein
MEYTMKKIITFIFLLAVTMTFAGGHITRIDRTQLVSGEKNISTIPYNVNPIPVPFLILDPGYQTDSLVIGPEILTTLSGFYDYKTNGESNHYIQVDPSDPLIIHVVDVQSDSLDAAGATTRKSYYAFSTNGGLTWENTGPTPISRRSGYPTLKLKNGVAVMANHSIDPTQNFLSAHLYVDLVPHAGSFTEYLNPKPLTIWPQIEVLSNGNIGMLSRPQHVTGTDFDTLYFQLWNGTSLQAPAVMYIAGPPWQNAATIGSNMRFNLATNGNGLLTASIAPVVEDDTLGNSLTYYRTSTDNGVTWGPLTTLFRPYIENGTDTIASAGGSDLIYKPNTNKWFFAMPITANNLFASGKLVMIKSDGTMSTITTAAAVNAATTYYQAMAFVFNLDFPSLGWSQDLSTLYCVYSVVTPDSASSGFNSRDIYYQYSTNEGTTWSTPVRITNTPNIDETYPSVSLWNPGIMGSVTYTLNFTYMKDPGVGPASFNGTGTLAPPSRNFQVYRKVIDAGPIGVKDPTSIADEYMLSQNYPNPFNPTTKISFSLPKQQSVTLKVYNIMGQEAASLINNKVYPAGTSEIEFSADKLASGAYFYTLEAGSFVSTKKMIILK